MILKTKTDVESAICCLSILILLGKATKERIETITRAAKEHGLLPLLKKEFLDIGQTLKGD